MIRLYLDVDCPKCGAKAESNCINQRNGIYARAGRTFRSPHMERKAVSKARSGPVTQLPQAGRE